jgi:hypothetical protein
MQFSRNGCCNLKESYKNILLRRKVFAVVCQKGLSPQNKNIILLEKYFGKFQSQPLHDIHTEFIYYLLTSFVTSLMEKSKWPIPSSKTYLVSTRQKMSWLLWNIWIHYCFHMSTPLAISWARFIQACIPIP